MLRGKTFVEDVSTPLFFLITSIIVHFVNQRGPAKHMRKKLKK
jgi:hypothetical protein